MKTTTEKAMVSKKGIRIERQMPEGVDDQSPKSRESDMYAVSKRGDLVNTHTRWAWRGSGISRAKGQRHCL